MRVFMIMRQSVMPSYRLSLGICEYDLIVMRFQNSFFSDM